MRDDDALPAERPFPRDRSRLLFRLMVALGVLAWVLAGLYAWINEPYWRLQNRLEELTNEAQVRREFGAPHRAAVTGGTDYRVPGYAAAKRAVTGKVLVYLPRSRDPDQPDVALYVFLDDGGRVEETFIGRR